MKKIYLTILISLFIYCKNSSAQIPCNNEDFEASPAGTVTTNGQIVGWLASSSIQSLTSNNCNMSTCCMNTPSNTILMSEPNGYIDPVIGAVYPIYSVFGSGNANTSAAAMNPQITFPLKGNNFIRLGTNVPSNGKMERISKTFAVTPTNNMMDVAFISVLTRGHDCCYGSMLKVTINSYTCPLIFTSGGSPGLCTDANKGVTFYTPVSGTLATAGSMVIFNKWIIRSLDLSAFTGQTVTVNFTTAHCASGGHSGYGYLDTRCGSMKLTANNSTVALTPGTTSVSTCGGTATITAPPYFEAYKWLGPQNFSTTSTSFTTNTPGIYTLSLSDSLSCNSTNYTIAVVPSATALISSNQATSCAGSAVTLSASGLSTYTWQNGATTSTISVIPSATTIYTLSGKDAYNCVVTQTFTQNVKICTSIYDYDVDPKSIAVFPNPNKGDFVVSAPYFNDGKLIIYNSFGQLVHAQKISEGKNTILTSQLPKGIYLYSVLNNNREWRKGKIIIE